MRSFDSRSRVLTVDEAAVIVDDALAQVDVTSLAVSFLVHQSGTEDGNITITLKGEVDVLCRLGEVRAIPYEVA